MQSEKIEYDVIRLTEARRCYPLNAAGAGEELFLGTCDSKGVGEVDVLVNTSIAKKINSFQRLTTRIGRLRMKRCSSMPALTIFVAYAPISNYTQEEVEAFYIDLERSCGENHTFYKITVMISTSKLALKEHLKNFTSGPTPSNR
ncbi:hypothetical protein RB195_002336 [Necator americanus]|uniref:Uncharacterized protein n=1 Tax=Necator americanus TaxID=51031 RepID=A0ABR1DIV2_NECAM